MSDWPCGYSTEPGRMCLLPRGHTVAHARTIICRCGKAVYAAQGADGSLFMVAHDGTTHCPTEARP